MTSRRGITLFGLLRGLLAVAAAAGIIRCLAVPAFCAVANHLQLAAAVEAGDTRAVAALLDHGADPNTETDDPQSHRPLTVLMLAASRGYTAIAEALLGHGAAVNAIRGNARALTLAVGCGHSETVRVLLEHGADPTLRARADDPPLAQAARVGQPAMVKLMLSHGAGKDPQDLNHALADSGYGGRPVIVRILLAAGADPNARGVGWSPLVRAVYGGQTAVAKVLLAAGADPSGKDDFGQTPLWAAAMWGRIDETRMLLAAGADPTVKDRFGRTALDEARENYHLMRERATWRDEHAAQAAEEAKRLRVVIRMLREAERGRRVKALRRSR